MIDLNRIRSLKTLEEMKRDLNDFLVHPNMRTVYLEEFQWSEDDYEADKELATELLEKVNRRIKSLSHYLKGQGAKQGLRQRQKSEPEASASEQ